MPWLWFALCLRAPRTEPLINEQLALHFWEKSLKMLVTLDDPCSEVSMSLKVVLFEDLTYILEGDMWRNWQKAQDCNSCSSHSWLIKECCRSSWGFVLAWPPNKTLLPDWQCIMHWARPGEVNICQMIGDKREGHFNHSSNQCCIRLYTYRYTYIHIQFVCVALHLVQMKSIVKVAAGSAKLAASTQWSRSGTAMPKKDKLRSSKYEVCEQFEVPDFVGQFCFMKAKILSALTSVDLNADDAKECKVRLSRCWVSSSKAWEDSAGDAWTSWVKFLPGEWLGSGCVFKTAPAYGKGSRSLQRGGSQSLVIVLCTLSLHSCLTFSLVLPKFGSIWSLLVKLLRICLK